MCNFLIIIIFSYADFTEDKTDHIEYNIFYGSESGMPYSYPGLIFRLYSDGTLLVAKDDIFEKYDIGKKCYLYLKREILNRSRKDFKIFKTCDDCEIYIPDFDEGFYSIHGVYSSVSVRTKNHQIVFVMPFIPKKKGFGKAIRRISRSYNNKNKECVISLESTLEQISMVWEVYFELWRD
jgi:hypothetical protein